MFDEDGITCTVCIRFKPATVLRVWELLMGISGGDVDDNGNPLTPLSAIEEISSVPIGTEKL